MTGRRRYIPEGKGDPKDWRTRAAYRQAINHPIQGFAAELNMMVAIELHERFGDRARLVGTVHDNCLIECRPEFQKEIVEETTEVLKHPALLDYFGLEIGVPLKGDIKIGAWGT
jgi:DNA polymerase I-like protein with 3'-5' exonuclease and polymerase domains